MMDAKRHLSIADAEGYLFRGSSLTLDQRQSIEEHIKECIPCSELVRLTQEFYEDFRVNLSRAISSDVLTLAESTSSRKHRLFLPIKSLSLNADTTSDVILSYRSSLIQKYVAIFKSHPFFSSSLVLVFSLLVFFLVLQFFPVSHSKNPYFARVENSVLSVYNREGNLLWQKSVPGVPDATNRDLFDSNRGEKRYLNICDIDGTGKNVVLLSGENSGSTYNTDSLYCFNFDGSLRWVTGTQLYVNFKGFKDALKSRWRIIEFMVVRPSPYVKPALYVIASDVIFPFSKIMQIDSETGRIVQSFTNPGRLEKIVAADVNGEGKEKIILGGINMAYRRACVVVLDPEHFGGVGPTKGDYFTSSSFEGTEMFYILLPLTDVGRILGLKQLNYTQHLVVDSGNFVTAKTVEAVGAPVGGSVFYQFGRGMNIKKVYFDDGFKKLRHELINERRIALLDNSTYAELLKRNVLFWDGKKFVNENKGNQNYLMIMSLR